MTTGDPATVKARLKKDWAPSSEAFRQLLVWLDAGAESSGEKYLEVRRRLVGYFRRKGSLVPDDLADEVLNRVARRLEEEGTTEGPPERYCYIVAKFVFLESLRNPDRHRTDVVPETLTAPIREENDRLEQLDQCLAQLTAADRHLILDYYRGDQGTRIEQRRDLAVRLSMTPNALALRASRLRARLEQCVAAAAKRI